MLSNWIIDRLLVVGILVLVVGALHVLPQLGIYGVAQGCGFAALVATLVATFTRHNSDQDH